MPSNSGPTRKEFLQAVAGVALMPTLSAAVHQETGSHAPKVLIVVAHPDDEFAFAATVYRITRELGGIADQVVITNGEAGYRYSALAESIYGVSLTSESEGRTHLPAIRKAEAIRAGEILGIRQHHFLNQRDSGFADNAAEASTGGWDRPHLLSTLSGLLNHERYDFVFTLLPTAETHAHHRAATLLVLDAVAHMPEAERPAVLGADPGLKQDAVKHDAAERFSGLSSVPLTATSSETPVITFDRTTSFGYRDALSYQIVVNWVIAEHKSQGLFQSDYGRYDVERFWLFTVSGVRASARTAQLAEQLKPSRNAMAVAR